MLIRHELLPLEEYDVQLAKLVTAKADSVIEFAASLMRICLLSPNSVSFLEDHILTVSALFNLVKNEEAPARYELTEPYTQTFANPSFSSQRYFFNGRPSNVN